MCVCRVFEFFNLALSPEVHFVRLSVIMMLLHFMHALKLLRFHNFLSSSRSFDTVACHENADGPSIFMETSTSNECDNGKCK